jgi:multisubunit Na+/H+ antiporter MnhC subunit
MNLSMGDMVFLVVFGVFGIGLYALLVLRNLIKFVIALQMLVKAVVR